MLKKFTSLLLILTLLTGICLLPVVSVAESAESTAIDHNLDIALYTVPMKASVVILYAIKSSSVPGVNGLKLVVTKGEEPTDVLPTGRTIINGEEYIIFEYKGLSASEMRSRVSAYVCYGDARGSAVEYSVADFAEAYIAKGGKYVDLVNAMLEYGDAVAKLIANS